MASLTIEETHHYDNKWFSSGPHVWQSEFTKEVTFDSSCAYQLPAYNSEDVNKLFGASYGFFGIHRNSVRFGWRYSNTDKKIELLAYVYDKGAKNWDAHLRYPVVAQVELGETVRCRIHVTASEYIFHVTAGDATAGRIVTVGHTNRCRWGWTASLYFGGALPAPHRMHVTMT